MVCWDMNNTAQSQRQTIVREWEAQQSATSQLESPATEKGETTMKSAGTMTTVCLLLTASTLFAQSESQRPMKVNVPFAFGVEPFPARRRILHLHRDAGQDDSHRQRRRQVLGGHRYAAQPCREAGD